MSSSFMGIELGKRSVMSHSRALHTVGHNLANAETEGYSRQRVEMQATQSLTEASLVRDQRPGQIGTGVEVSQVVRYEDMLLEGRIVQKGGDFGFWSTREKWLSRAQAMYNETSGASIRSAMDQFFNSWNELALAPENLEFRHDVATNSQTLMDRMNETFNLLDDMRSDVNTQVVDTVRQINEITGNIATLNEKIVQSEAVGDNPNDLKDSRDRLTRELSELVNVEVEYRDNDEYSLTVDGKTLVQGKQIQLLRAIEDPQNRGLARVIWDHDGSDFTGRGGALAALIEVRDTELRGEIQKLDTMAISFIDQVNEVHSKSFDLQGNTGTLFFEEFDYTNNVRGSFDSNADGELDQSLIFRIAGNNRLQATDQIGVEGMLNLNGSQIPYQSTDTVEQVINRINTSGSEVVAQLNSEGRLTLRAAAAESLDNQDFVLRHIEDSGEFLVGYAGVLNASGAEGAFDSDWNVTGEDALNRLAVGEANIQVSPLRNPSGWIRVNQNILNDVSQLAAAESVNGVNSGFKNGKSALLIAELNNRGPMVGEKKGYREFFSDLIADMGSKTRHAMDTAETQALYMTQMTNEKAELTSVNMDEELSNMMKYQHAYTAASRFVTTIDEMLDIIINRMGV